MTTAAAPRPAPKYFKSVSAFRLWLAAHHTTRTELWIGLYKKHAAEQGMTYPEAVDEALCWGWIDGVMYRVDDDRLAQRFTPRKSKSTWSLVNVGKVKALIAAGRMQPSGLAAFEARDAKRTGIYSFEQEGVEFSAPYLRRFKADRKAWGWFSAQGGSYRRTATHWVIRAKQASTRERRLQQLIDHSAAGKKLRQFTPIPERKR